MSNDSLKAGTLVWSGEHWINYIRRPGESTDSGMVSLYNTRFSAAGEGIAAFVYIPGNDGFTGYCTNNREVASFMFDTMIRGKGNALDRELPVLDATFEYEGDAAKQATWTIEASGRRVESVWTITEPPTMMYGPAHSGEPMEIFSVLNFTNKTSMKLDGRAVEGKPYTRDIWKKSIGGNRSSCVFALAETFIRIG